jgi:hypothetical protein
MHAREFEGISLCGAAVAGCHLKNQFFINCSMKRRGHAIIRAVVLWLLRCRAAHVLDSCVGHVKDAAHNVPANSRSLRPELALDSSLGARLLQRVSGIAL